jgi:hypothetical protein
MTAFVAFAAFNLLAALFLRGEARQVIARVGRGTGITQLAIGNSLVAYGYNSIVYDDRMGGGAHSINAAMSGSSPVEHLLMLRQGLAHQPKLRSVIYGFFDFQLTSNPPVEVSQLFGANAMGLFTEPKIAIRYYNMSWTERLKFSVLNHVPVYVNRGNLWWFVEILRRKLYAIGLPHKADEGPDVGFSVNMQPLTDSEFDAEARKELARGLALSPPVLEMLREARADGILFVVIEMPIRRDHLRLYELPSWTRYAAEVRHLVESQGGLYIDGSRWINDPDYFWDDIHLTATGGRRFSSDLADYLRNRRDSANAASVSPLSWNLSPRNRKRTASATLDRCLCARTFH